MAEALKLTAVAMSACVKRRHDWRAGLQRGSLVRGGKDLLVGSKAVRLRWPQAQPDRGRPVGAFFALVAKGWKPAQIRRSTRRRSPRRVAGEPALAGLQELLRPRVIHALGDAFAPAKLGD